MKTKVLSVVELTSEQQERKHVWARGMGCRDLGFLLTLCDCFPLKELKWGFFPFELSLLEEGGWGEGRGGAREPNPAHTVPHL